MVEESFVFHDVTAINYYYDNQKKMKQGF